MSNFVNYTNAEALMTAIAQKFASVEGAYVFKGSVTFANLPETLNASKVGYVYNLSEEFTTDARFVEGAGKKYPAGTNVSIADIGDATTPVYKFDILAGFIDVDAIYNAIADVAAMIADEFLATVAYDTGDLVTYNGGLYRFKADHAIGDWVGTDADAVTVESIIDEILATATALATRIDATQADIAPTFDATSGVYAIGDLVIKDNQLYRFKAAHDPAGAWVASEVDAIDIDTIVKELTLADANLTSRVNQLVADLAPAFDTTVAYAIGDVVTYTDDKVYRFKAAHAAGAWVGTDVDAVTIATLIADAEPEPLTTAQVEALIALLD